MKLYIFILIEIIFLMMIGLIIYHSEQSKSLKLSIGLNKIIFIIGLIKLTGFIYVFNKNMKMCDLANEIWC